MKSILYIIFLILILCTEFITNYGAVDKIGPQWLYLSIINIIIITYNLFKNKTGFSDLVFKSKISKAYLRFILFCLISIFFAVNQIESLNYFSRILLIFITYLNLQWCIKFTSENQILWILTIIFCIEGLTIFNQFTDLFEFGVDFGRNPKLIGVASNINIAGFSIALLLPYALLMQKKLDRFKKIFLSCLISLSIFSGFLTGSRGTILSITIIYIVFLIKEMFTKNDIKNKIKQSLYLIIPFLFSIIISEILFDSMRYSYRMNQIIERGSSSRIDYYSDALNSFKEKPLTGIGIGNWKLNSIEKGKRHIEGYIVPYHSHNDFIQLLAETGILGLFFYFMIFILSLYKPIRKLSILKEPILFSCFCFMLIYFLDANLNFPIARPIMQTKLALVLAILTKYDK